MSKRYHNCEISYGVNCYFLIIKWFPERNSLPIKYAHLSGTVVMNFLGAQLVLFPPTIQCGLYSIQTTLSLRMDSRWSTRTYHLTSCPVDTVQEKVTGESSAVIWQYMCMLKTILWYSCSTWSNRMYLSISCPVHTTWEKVTGEHLVASFTVEVKPRLDKRPWKPLGISIIVS